MNIVEQATRIRQDMNAVTSTLTDADGLVLASLFEPWTLKTYSIGDRVRHLGKLYRCVQVHTSQTDWNPPLTPALWTVISVEEYPQWVQPAGAHDAYQVGAKVSYNGKHWLSTAANNVWEPGVYGWSAR